MDKYYYLIAQLPFLVFDKSSYMHVSMFLDESGKWLSHKDLKRLLAVKLFSLEVGGSIPRVIRHIPLFERQLRKDLAHYRQAIKKGTDFKPESFSAGMLKEGNPLENEKKLLAVRWRFIESLEQDHHFDLAFLMLYYLKLQIMQKLSEYDKVKGFKHFQQLSKVTE